MIINKALLTPRNFIAIAIMTLIAHVVARPLYNIVDNKGSSE